MPRNGSGIYGPPAGTAAVPNTTIESADYNSVVADMSQALTDSINVDGTAPFQGNQSMGDNKLTNLAVGSTAGDSINLGQAQSGIITHAISVGGTADAITAAFSPAFAAWTARMRFRFTAAAANTSAAPTINVDGLGAKIIKKLSGSALEVGDISGSGHVCECVYNGTDVLLLNPGFWPGRANTFANDIDQIFAGRILGTLETLTDGATIAWDMATRPNDIKILLSASRSLGAATNLVENQRGRIVIMQDGTGGWNLTANSAYKQAGGQTVLDLDKAANARTVFDYYVIKNSGGTNEVWLERLWSEGRNSIGSYKEYDKGALNSASIFTQAHGLGRAPALILLILECTTAERGYSVGDRIFLLGPGNTGDGIGSGTTISFDNANVVVAKESVRFSINDKSSGNSVLMTSQTNWKIVIRIYE
jgi:hypothetical protein